ncbi:glycerate kinase type-2 family protein [Notoacmeibacter ruber]|uniref:DUF4147 domain-containing protein n=1 Tax=Notoacmeibacter ruber TaxID=2670375 RepID=A0A3L7JDA7_9HYPH|nr:DUF4147 domain-containing protein [Notoacmeibacter ruber]RLQ87561.1 DUF4147 domain-containing protein [Notoacmeibacter ruber]
MEMTKGIEALRQDARDLFQAGVEAADPGPATARALDDYRNQIDEAQSLTLLALGKGAVAMAEAALPVLRSKLRRGVIVTTEMAARPVADLKVISAGHPVPNGGSLAGGEALAEAASEAGEGELVVVLISGGGSALAVAPAEGLELADKIALNEALLKSGADIVEMNAMRSAASRLKGGGLARLAHPAKVLSLILSDVPGDDPAVVASGPTAVDRRNARALEAAVDRLRMSGFPSDKLELIQHAVHESDIMPEVINRIVGSNEISLETVAQRAAESGWGVEILDRWLDGDVEEAARRFLAAARASEKKDHPIAILAGGETSVTVSGEGRGGRNQELTLHFARLCQDGRIDRPWCFLSGGTDGRDGPTDAAGGVVDAATWDRIERSGADAEALLADNDSHRALAAAGDLLVTGSTGTNVADIQILLLK